MNKQQLIDKMMKEDALALKPLTCCEIFYVQVGAHIRWGWRAGRVGSKPTFDLFYDCVEDARRRGYHVNLELVPSELLTAPLT
ncbi:MAG TPA: hypothetical protein VM164_04850 [Burkholderiales bacterium]|nr:hypothetical protein [Burkholderiales bacterium]